MMGRRLSSAFNKKCNREGGRGGQTGRREKRRETEGKQMLKMEFQDGRHTYKGSTLSNGLVSKMSDVPVRGT